MSARTASRRRQLAIRLNVGALVWSAGLVVAALVVPAYDSSETSAGVDGVTLTHATLVQVNGARALVVMAIPALVSAVALWAIRARRAGARWGAPVAWASVTVLAAETVVGILTIGVFILPATVLLVAAVRLATGAPAGGEPARPGHGAPGATSEPAAGT
jgi:hypothetical protein